LNTLLGGTRATVRDLGIALLLLRARSLLAGTAAKTTAADMTLAGGSAGRLGGRLTALTAAPWVLTVLIAYQDIKDPHSIERRAKGLFDLVKKGGLIEQGLESLPTVGPVIAALHAATNVGPKKLGPGQSPIGENALPGGPGRSTDVPPGGAAPPPRLSRLV
jgi:hypothetical protein